MIKLENYAEAMQSLNRLPYDLKNAAVDGMHKELKEYLKLAQRDAPEDKGNLKNEMEIDINRGLMEGSLITNAYSSTGFNYAYYLHEIGSQKGYKPRKPGKTLEWLKVHWDADRSLQNIEDYIKQQMRAKGW